MLDVCWLEVQKICAQSVHQPIQGIYTNWLRPFLRMLFGLAVFERGEGRHNITEYRDYCCVCRYVRTDTKRDEMTVSLFSDRWATLMPSTYLFSPMNSLLLLLHFDGSVCNSHKRYLFWQYSSRPLSRTFLPRAYIRLLRKILFWSNPNCFNHSFYVMRAFAKDVCQLALRILSHLYYSHFFLFITWRDR